MTTPIPFPGIKKKLSAEQVSACLDGEFAPADIDALLADEQARQCWQRYHLIRDCIQDEMPAYTDFNLADKVSAALAQEAALSTTDITGSTTNKSRRPIWQAVTSFAVAASVFAVVVVSWQQWQTPAVNNAEQMAGSETLILITPDSALAQTAHAPLGDEQRRLEELLINHTEAVSANGLQVMLPYARVVSERMVLPVSEEDLNAATETEAESKKTAKPLKSQP